MSSGKAPTIAQAARSLEETPADTRASFQRLADGHIIILQTTGEVMAANPFANVPTPFVVQSGKRRYTAMCVWDALGIPAMLGADATVHTACGDCNDAIELTVKDGKLAGVEAVVHFAIPAKHWWDNIVFT